jgi:Protein of unknown function (DUF2380)
MPVPSSRIMASRVRRRLLPLVLLLLSGPLLSIPARAADKPSLAVFGFELINSSLEPTRPDELERLAMIDRLLVEKLEEIDAYTLVDTSPVAEKVAKAGSLRGCNGCELGLARELGASHAALGWVQKVSNLILNINLQIREVETGRLVEAGSVDIRGNTDESWHRGVVYLLERRIFDTSR